jgi:four helix bundle protein
MRCKLITGRKKEGRGEEGKWGMGEEGKRGSGEEEKRRRGEEGKWGNEGMGNFVYLFLTAAKNNIMEIIKSHRELIAYQMAFRSSMEIFKLTRSFPKEEVYSLTSQIRRSSRSVSGNLAEAFRKRRYKKAFVSKLSDSEAEAAETQVWLDYSLECGYMSKDDYDRLFNEYDKLIGKLVIMMRSPEKWSQSS